MTSFMYLNDNLYFKIFYEKKLILLFILTTYENWAYYFYLFIIYKYLK